MTGRYPRGSRIPSATDYDKLIYVGNLQACDVNISDRGVMYICTYTSAGGKNECPNYARRVKRR